MKSLFLILACLFLTVAAVFGQSAKKVAKREARAKEYAATKALIESGTFSYVADWATTQKGARINLATNGNSLIVTPGESAASMPYFGAVQVPNMSGEGGINFDDQVKNYKVDYKEKKMKIIVSFDVRSSNGNENFHCVFNISSRDNASLGITSGARNSITYEGKIAEWKEKN
ncbi:hypothetical protein BFP72_01990 [Reichenbachiella sp. 5M10]|uniref:DUF4251 domain-containing protein n=1 Tax=Reichenbachiella sp. 5M10 TaxID=1889772 RepID=UPI000C1543A7|nr:DUF4251 domain-containing protein [Reichenbachiella sp. 5M10]PIB34287.1 hypothetical protein BFP72_01990 [Reichenbachiella sp. 5M10]